MSATKERLVAKVAEVIEDREFDGKPVLELAEAVVDAVLLASVDEVVGRYIEEITAAYTERAKQ